MALDEHETPGRVLILGGGVAGVEAAMAVADLAGSRARIELVSPEAEFLLKAMTVVEPFGGRPAERHDLSHMLEGIGARHVRGQVAAVDADARTVQLKDGSSLGYDHLVVCVGGRAEPAYTSASVATFQSDRKDIGVDQLIERAADHPSRTLAVVIPPKTTWPLPAYEIALMLSRRVQDLGRQVTVEVLTPEDQPLGIFGLGPSQAVAEHLAARSVVLRTSEGVREEAGELRCVGGEVLSAGAVVALPRIVGPRVAGLPCDEAGFIRVDEHCRVIGVDDVYAAGDGTSFPVKQGGIGAQQADAAAEDIAARLGADIDPEPFKPVLRGKLLTGSDSIKMKHALTGGDRGEVSPDFLWWPRTKVTGRYISAWLAHTSPVPDLEPREMPIEVEASWPHEWHGDPLLGPPQL